MSQRSQEQDWEDDALCKEYDDSLWFTETDTHERIAKKICMRCPVRGQCLERAVLNKEKFGVWGGLTPRERQAYIRKLRRSRR